MKGYRQIRKKMTIQYIPFSVVFAEDSLGGGGEVYLAHVRDRWKGTESIFKKIVAETSLNIKYMCL